MTIAFSKAELAFYVLEVSFRNHYKNRIDTYKGPFLSTFSYDSQYGECAVILGGEVWSDLLNNSTFISHIKYRYYDPIEGVSSPIFAHGFKSNAVSFVDEGTISDKLIIPGVRYYPWTKAWPEHRIPDMSRIPQFVS